MLQFKLKGGISLLDKVLAMTKESINRKKKEKARKKGKDQKKARRIAGGGKKKKKANPTKGYVEPRTAEQRAKSKAKKKNKPIKAMRAAARKKK